MTLDESTSSSDAADVLIHSTKATFSQKRQKSGNVEPALSRHRDVNIYVQRLSDSVHGLCLVESGVVKQMVPPVIPVNIHSASPPGTFILSAFLLCCEDTHGIKNKYGASAQAVQGNVKLQLIEKVGSLALAMARMLLVGVFQNLLGFSHATIKCHTQYFWFQHPCPHQNQQKSQFSSFDVFFLCAHDFMLCTATTYLHDLLTA